MTTFEREADLQLAGLPAIGEALRWRRRAGVRGGRSRRAHDRRAGDAPNEAGQQARAELGIGEPLTGDRRAIYEWVAREDGRPMGDLLAA